MTIKDYKKFADLFYKHIEFDKDNINGIHVINDIITLFKEDNVKFDEMKFRYYIHHGSMKGYK